ncbi:hypothetical protein [Flavobacterium sp. LB2P53]|uniref:hypothetical protein n=1 Tax=Flavobacterium sp. LB2P53 TaxID=2497481 RepID=UPI000F83DA80|nr:hypothetical protein [Flavobacterium sp. LB2P53]RTY70365.1 hypothetical protein EKL95_03155 [Flavobacterium sp. LB2P53]
MSLLIKKNKVAFLLLVGLNLFVAFAASFILPKRFFYDAAIIAYDNGNEIGYFGSYPLTILFYKISGLRYLPFSIIALIQFSILMGILYRIGIPSTFEKVTIKNILVYFAFIMIAIFMAMPSKEFITFLYLSVIVFLFQNKHFTFQTTLFIALSLFVFFGVIYRPYFALLPIVAMGMYWVTCVKIPNRTFATLFYGIVIVIFLSLSYGFVQGEFFSEQSRELINSARLGSVDANSSIVSPVKTDTWYGEIIGILYGFFTVNVPLNGLKHIFSPQILLFVIWQLFLFYILLVRLARCIKDKKEYVYELWMLLFIFSFFIIQGVFEPDLGSAIRHKMGVFPLIYYALYYDHFRKAIQ